MTSSQAKASQNRRGGIAWAIVVAVVLTANACGSDPLADPSWQQDFSVEGCKPGPTGTNEYFVLETGFQVVLEGGGEKVAITVLDETRTITGIETRVVEEREWRNDELIEVSRNFFAICDTTLDVFYFGEEVDDYKGGQITGHGGAWIAGENGARPGLIMSGNPALAMRYYQEVAPGVALDRAEIVSLNETLDTPAGTFSGALKTEETSGLKRERGFKTYASGIGLIQDERLLLTDWGFVDG
ncbi:MAG: hypothetical protein U9N84_03670 [Actinomycetota bacterium]|nr:hypothetical protein [Actinomycetota bacterium]